MLGPNIAEGAEFVTTARHDGVVSDGLSQRNLTLGMKSARA